MDVIAYCMNIGTILAAIATIPQIYAVWKDRNILKGYLPIPCFLLGVAMILFATAFYYMDLWPSVIAEIPPATFWFSASFYSWRARK